MLNLKSKNEVIKAVATNQDRFATAKKKLIDFNLKRDAKTIINDVIPALKNQLATMKFFKGIEWFEFSLPVFDFADYDLSSEEKERILFEYYKQEGILWTAGRGEISHASLINKVFHKEIGIKVVFRKCDIEGDTVYFSLHLIEDILKTNVKEEVSKIAGFLDEQLEEHFNFDTIAEKINLFYQQIKDSRLAILYKNDLEQLPLFDLNVESILRGSDFYAKANGIEGVSKIQIDNYLNESKLIAKVQRKLKRYGYKLDLYTTSPKDEPFRATGFKILLQVLRNSDPKLKDTDSLVICENLKDTFKKKKRDYDAALKKRCIEENQHLTYKVRSGMFDNYISKKLVEAMLLYPRNIMLGFKEQFRQGYYLDDLRLSFTLPFNRQFEGTVDFGRHYHEFDGVGHRYMNLKNNAIDAMKERYPFLSLATLTGDNFYDFKYREGMHGTDEFILEENTLSFGFKFDGNEIGDIRESVFEFLSSYFGVLNVEPFFKEIGFNGDSISQKIEDYASQHSAGNATVNDKFRLVVGSISTDEIRELYQASRLFDRTQAVFEQQDTKDFYYSYYDSEHKQAKHKEELSLKLMNLFSYSLVTNPLFNQLADELTKFDYKLKVAVVPVGLREVFTERYSLHNTKIMRDLADSHVLEIVIE